MTPGAHFRLASFSGLIVGVVCAHVDLLIRIIEQHVEWFDPYLALITNVEIFLIVSWLIALLLFGLPALFRSSFSADFLRAFYAATVLCFSSFVSYQLLVNLVLYNDPTDWNKTRLQLVVFGAGMILLLYLLCMTRLKRHLLAVLDWCVASGLRSLMVNYIWFLGFLCAICLAMDVYQQWYIPAPPLRAKDGGIKPNVVMITLDTVRADHLSLYGYSKRTTPNIDRLADDAVVFLDAISTSPWTLAAHASLFTGRWVSGHNAHMQHQKLDEDQLTLAEVFAKNGYATGGFVGGPYCIRKYGLAQGFTTYRDRLDFFEWRHTPYLFNARKLIQILFPDLYMFLFQADGERIAPEINNDVFRWIDHNKQAPFFLFINYFDAHNPYNLGAEYRKKFTKLTFDADKANQLLDLYGYTPKHRYTRKNPTAPFLEFVTALYDAELYYLDSYVGRLIDKLEEEGLKENTIIVVTSDHGEEFFDHGGVYHGQTLFNELLHIPLLISYPGGEFESFMVDSRVGLEDVFPTVLELAGIKARAPEEAQSLVPYMREGDLSSVDNPVLAERFGRIEHNESDLRAVYSGPWKLIRAQPEQERIKNSLFFIAQDRAEKVNSYHSNYGVQQRMEKLLRDLIGEQEVDGSAKSSG